LRIADLEPVVELVKDDEFGAVGEGEVFLGFGEGAEAGGGLGDDDNGRGLVMVPPGGDQGDGGEEGDEGESPDGWAEGLTEARCELGDGEEGEGGPEGDEGEGGPFIEGEGKDGA
jgi:hypothetical protein